MPDLPDLEAALSRIQQLADRIGRRARLVALVAAIAAVAAWALLLRRWIFDSPGVFVGWLPLLVILVVPALILSGFGKRMIRLGPAIDRIADEAGVVVGELRDEAGARVTAVRRGGLRTLLGALRQLPAHGERVRGLVADAAGTARVLALPYLGLVALAAGAAVIIGVLALIGLATLAL